MNPERDSTRSKRLVGTFIALTRFVFVRPNAGPLPETKPAMGVVAVEPPPIVIGSLV